MQTASLIEHISLSEMFKAERNRCESDGNQTEPEEISVNEPANFFSQCTVFRKNTFYFLKDDLRESLQKLPALVQLKILDHYLKIKAKQKKINWPNRLSRIKDYDLFCKMYDKLTDDGYFKIETTDLNFIQEKFPNIRLNPNIEKSYLHKMMEDSWAEAESFENPNVAKEAGLSNRYAQVAGGFFTMYQLNIFTEQFKYYLMSFNVNPYVDFYINYYDKRKKVATAGRNWEKIDGYENIFNLVVKKINRLTEVSDKFEYDCCKKNWFSF